jgi:hypothetical protein
MRITLEVEKVVLAARAGREVPVVLLILAVLV